MSKNIIYIALVAFAFFFAGCATKMGKQFDDSYVEKIKRGVTTKTDIRKNIGEPSQISHTNDMQVWSYTYSKSGNLIEDIAYSYGLSEEKGSAKILSIVFSGNKVKSYTYSKSQ